MLRIMLGSTVACIKGNPPVIFCSLVQMDSSIILTFKKMTEWTGFHMIANEWFFYEFI